MRPKYDGTTQKSALSQRQGDSLTRQVGVLGSDMTGVCSLFASTLNVILTAVVI